MKDKFVNYSLLKKTIIVMSFLINVAGLLLISFFCTPWIYFGVCCIAFCIFFIMVIANRYIYNKFFVFFGDMRLEKYTADGCE